MDRRSFLKGTSAGAAALTLPVAFASEAMQIEYTTEEYGTWTEGTLTKERGALALLNDLGNGTLKGVRTRVRLFIDGEYVQVHAVRLQDGREWDVVNGWRHTEEDA